MRKHNWMGIGQDWMNYSSRSFCEEKSFHNLINHLPLIDLGSLFWSLFDHWIIELNIFHLRLSEKSKIVQKNNNVEWFILSFLIFHSSLLIRVAKVVWHLRRKVWTRTENLSPNICYFVAIYALIGRLWTKKCFFLGNTVFIG